MVAGCASYPIGPSQARLAPTSHIYAFQNGGPKATSVVVTRDNGFGYMGCGAVVLVDGVKSAKLGEGQKVRLNIQDGRHIFGVEMDRGICTAGYSESQIHIDGPTHSRISYRGRGGVRIAPSAL